MTFSLNKHNDLPQEIESLARQVVDCVFHVHRELGSGLLEKIYEEALCRELSLRSIPFTCQQAFAVPYKGQSLPSEYRLDLLVDGQIVLELKTIERIMPVHEAQIMTYMRLCHAPMGFIVNFNECLIKNGIKRIVLSGNKHVP